MWIRGRGAIEAVLADSGWIFCFSSYRPVLMGGMGDEHVSCVLTWAGRVLSAFPICSLSQFQFFDVKTMEIIKWSTDLFSQK
jgi:hypothetical protein